MLKKNLLFYSLILVFVFAKAQTPKFSKLYYDSEWHLTKKNWAKYIRTTFIIQNEGNPHQTPLLHGPITDYYSDGTVQMTGVFSQSIPVDTFKFYYQSGRLEKKSIFKDGLRSGIWTYYHPNGNLHQRIKFVEGDFDSVYELYTYFGDTLVYEGNGNYSIEYFDSEIEQVIKISGEVKDSLRVGKWIYDRSTWGITQEKYNNNGELIFTEIGNKYKILPPDEKFKTIWLANDLGKQNTYPHLKYLPRLDSCYFLIDKYPILIGGFEELKKKILSTLPSNKDALFAIEVDKDGLPKIIKESAFNLQLSMINRLDRIMKSFKFIPAKRDSQNVSSAYSIRYYPEFIGKENIIIQPKNALLSRLDCKCSQSDLVDLRARYYNTSDVVFTGKVLEIDQSFKLTSNGLMIFDVLVDDVFKGDIQNNKIEGTISNSCSFYPHESGKWLIYGNMINGFLEIDHCSPSRSLKSPHILNVNDYNLTQDGSDVRKVEKKEIEFLGIPQIAQEDLKKEIDWLKSKRE